MADRFKNPFHNSFVVQNNFWAMLGVCLGLWCWILPSAADGAVVINEIYYHPASQNSREEFLELLNTGDSEVAVTGWRFSRGVDFTFPSAAIPAHGFLVVAADVDVFKNLHPGVTNVIGGWTGTLSNHGETLELVDVFGVVADTVSYATEGDWAVRERGPLDFNHYGWIWVAEHDGGGKSLELINPELDHNCGQNWSSSQADGGTPGAANSVASANIAPLIQSVQHWPAVPHSTESVRVTAQISDESLSGVIASLFYRTTGASNFTEVALLDDGHHSDGKAGDGVYGAVIPPQPADTVVEFYLGAKDGAGLVRFWPDLARPDFAPRANLLYQVDDRINATTMPFYYLVMTESERAEFIQMVNDGYGRYSNARMNATFIAVQNGAAEVCYLTGIRHRGGGSRLVFPNNFRVEFANDRPWHQVDKINLNARYPFVQLVGSVMSQMAGMLYTQSRPAQVRLNNTNLAGTDYPMYGFYAHNESLDYNFANARALGQANIYRGIRAGTNAADLVYRGENPDEYRGAYSKETNQSEDDWSDFIALTRVLSNTILSDSEYYQQVNASVDVDEWLRFFALNSIFDNNETTISSGSGDDYALYHDVASDKFVLFPYDLDTILGQGDSAGSPTASLFRATALPVIQRFLLAPEYVPRYYAQLLALLDGPFAAGPLDRALRQALSGVVPDYFIGAIENFVAARGQYIRSQIPLKLSILHDLPVTQGYAFTTNQTVSLHGVSDAVRTRQVLVNGQTAQWTAWQAQWQITNLALQPGINRILVQALDTNQVECDRLSLDVWCQPGTAGRTVTGTLPGITIWNAAEGPFLVAGDVVVPADSTLQIQPGTSVYFASGASLTVNGQILAEGTATNRIHFGPVAGAANAWGGLLLTESVRTNRLAYCDLVGAGSVSGRSLEVRNAVLELSHVDWSDTARAAILFSQASLRVEDCAFPAAVDDDVVRGTGLMPGGVLCFLRNEFPRLKGWGQGIRFQGNSVGGDLLQCYRNRFLGGKEAGIQLAFANACIEGNRFGNFAGTAYSVGVQAAGSASVTNRVVIARNLFADSDRGLLVYSNAAVTAHNNTFAQLSQFGVSFSAPQTGDGSGIGGELLGNLFYDTSQWLVGAESLTDAQFRVQSNWLPEGISTAGQGNISGDPLLELTDSLFLLRAGSPARGTGPNGLDMGYAVPAGLSVAGLPIGPSPARNLQLDIWGPGVAAYSYQWDDSPWSTQRLVSEPLILGNLTNGSHTLSIQGFDLFGTPALSGPQVFTWTIDASAPAVWLNEIYAGEQVGSTHGAGNWIELVNRTEDTLDLGGMSLSDDASVPTRFVFPMGTQLNGGGWLVVPAGDSSTEYNLGFALAPAGGALFLFDAPARGGKLLDQVAYGRQLVGMSIGRVADGSWQLTQPSPGTNNQRQAQGDAASVMINEWLAKGNPPQTGGFVELYNADRWPVRLDGLYLSDDPASMPFKYGFATLSFLAGQECLALWEVDATVNASHQLNFKLGSDQGAISLTQADGSVVDRIWYGPQSDGISQGRITNGGATVVAFALPSPGCANAATVVAGTTNAFPQVLINEILADNRRYPDSQGEFASWAELYNTSASAVDLSGMILSDRLDTPRTWEFAAGTVLPAFGYLRVGFNPALAASTNNTGYSLNASGGALYLLRAASQGGGIQDGVAFGFQSPDLSLGRDSANGYAWRPCTPTPGAPNVVRALGSVADLRINEWLARPASGSDWLEVYNGSDGPVDMGGLELTDGWNPTGGGRIPEYSFIDSGVFAYRVFYADSNTRSGADHLNFKLAKEGEALSLFDARGNAVDQVVFGAQKSGQAEGCVPDGSTNIVPCVASPGLANEVDSDNDGLPDAWETQFSFNPLVAGDGQADADQDAQSNYAEYLAGTNPRDAQSNLKIDSISPNGKEVVIQFTAVAGKAYTIFWIASLSDKNWTPLKQIPAGATTESITIRLNTASEQMRYYRLGLSN